jgi:hypothetical protein
MNAHRIETTVEETGELHLSGLPFRSGAKIEVIILERDASPRARERTFPFRGLPHMYTDPFEPACPIEDWEVYKE